MSDCVLFDLNPANLAAEHICCAIGDAKSTTGTAAKKNWMLERMAEGLQFRRLNVRGKIFVEYLPLEAAWVPVDGPDCYFINCFWVSGSYAGQGWGKALMDSVIADARNSGKKTIAIISAAKKRPFLADPGFLKHLGFKVCDSAEPYFQLWYLALDSDAIAPQFRDSCKSGRNLDQAIGLQINYTVQCPYTDFQAQDVLQWAQSKGIDCRLQRLESRAAALASPVPWTTWGIWWQGRYISHELLNASRAEKMLMPLISG